MPKVLFKPYDQVIVKCDGYSFCGQVITYPIGEGTIMVRRVPDDPSTMEEMPIDSLSRTNKSDYRWVHYATINGRGVLPVDMLRYDFAAPVNFRLGSNQYREVEKLSPGDEELIIARCTSRMGVNPWTDGRWRSFSWVVRPFGKPIKIKGRE